MITKEKRDWLITGFIILIFLAIILILNIPSNIYKSYKLDKIASKNIKSRISSVEARLYKKYINKPKIHYELGGIKLGESKHKVLSIKGELNKKESLKSLWIYPNDLMISFDMNDKVAFIVADHYSNYNIQGIFNDSPKEAVIEVFGKPQKIEEMKNVGIEWHYPKYNLSFLISKNKVFNFKVQKFEE